MTANQIANAANLEMNRHNLVSEEISNQSNEIAKDRNRIQEDYNNRITDIQERYNNTYLAIQDAQGQKKLDLQEELNWIEFQKYNAEANYKAEMARINQQDADTRGRAQIETERYQKRLNELGFTDQEIKAQLANIQEKQTEYNRYFSEQNVRIQDFNSLVNKMKVDNDYSLGLIRAELEETKNEMNYELQQYKQAEIVTSSIWDGFKSIAGFITGRR